VWKKGGGGGREKLVEGWMGVRGESKAGTAERGGMSSPLNGRACSELPPPVDLFVRGVGSTFGVLGPELLGPHPSVV